MFQKLKLRTYNDELLDEYQEVQPLAVQPTAVDNNITLVKIYRPHLPSCDAGHRSSISQLLKLDDLIFVGDFIAHSSLQHSRVRKRR